MRVSADERRCLLRSFREQGRKSGLIGSRDANDRSRSANEPFRNAGGGVRNRGAAIGNPEERGRDKNDLARGGKKTLRNACSDSEGRAFGFAEKTLLIR